VLIGDALEFNSEVIKVNIEAIKKVSIMIMERNIEYEINNVISPISHPSSHKPAYLVRIIFPPGIGGTTY
jgi:hypothetical protein